MSLGTFSSIDLIANPTAAIATATPTISRRPAAICAGARPPTKARPPKAATTPAIIPNLAARRPISSGIALLATNIATPRRAITPANSAISRIADCFISTFPIAQPIAPNAETTTAINPSFPISGSISLGII